MLKRMTVPLIATGIAIVIVLVIASTCSFGKGTTERPLVPDVVGMTQVAATDALKNSGFTVAKVTEELSVSSSPGTVLRQDPIAGITEKRGSAVDLVLIKP